MNGLYTLLTLYAPWIVGMCGIVFLWNLITLILGGAKHQYAFTLEFERANRQRDRSLWWMTFSVIAAAFVIYISQRTLPTLSDELFDRPTPTVTTNFFTTPSPIGITQNGVRPTLLYPTLTPAIAPTATLGNVVIGENVEKFIPAQPTRQILDVPTQYEGCEDDVVIDRPRSGTTLSEGVALFGRATAPNFNYYTIEISGTHTGGQWIDLLGGTINAPVENGFLGSGRLDGWETGLYEIELLVFDRSNRTAGACRIQIGILNEN